MPEVKLQGFVGINSDDEYQMVPQPDTITGENIVIQSTSEGQNASVKPRLGDTFRFEIQDFVQSSKKYRIRSLVSYSYFANQIPAGGYNSIYAKISSQDGSRVFAEGTGFPSYDSAGNLLTNPLQSLRSILIDELTYSLFYDPGNPNTVVFDLDLGIDDQGSYLDITTPAGIVIASNTVPPVTTAIENPNAYFDDFVVSIIGDNYSVTCISESIRPSMAGPAKVIGSVDYLGDTFLFSCTENKPIISFKANRVVVQNGFLLANPFAQINPYAIVTCINHGLQNGDLIDIYIANDSFISGTYDVTVIDQNEFYLNAYPYTETDYNFNNNLQYNPGDEDPIIYSEEILITKNVRSVGEIGVFYKKYNDDELYVRLLRSIELNFRTYHQIDVEAESTLEKVALYFTDNFNKPRLFYYNGEYIEDGALQFVNALNTYQYGIIDEQTRLVISSNSLKIKFIEQLQSGGNLYAGNKRYVVRGLTSDFTKGFWTNATGEIPVYAPSITESARKIRGNSVGKQTEKANVLEISGINTDIYTYIEIGIIEYLESGYESFIIDRVPINNKKTIKYIHNGSETEKSAVNPQEFNLDNKSIRTALNVSILDNRLLLSNIKYRSESSLEAILSTVKYSLKHYKMPKQGKEVALNGSSYALPNNGLTVAEYQRPENVEQYIGYMPNETYLFAARFIFKDGFASKPIPFVTVKFDTNQTSDDGRRISGLPSNNIIADASYDIFTKRYQDGNLLINHIEFSDFNFGAIIDGTPAFQLIDRVEIMRAQVDNPTVIACGLGVLGVRTAALGYAGVGYPLVEPNKFIVCSENPPQFVGSAETFVEFGYSSCTNPGFQQYRDIVSIYSPDYLFTDRQYGTLENGTVLIDFGIHQHIPPVDTYIEGLFPAGNSDGSGGYIHFGGNSLYNSNLVEYQIEEGKDIEDGGQFIFNNTTTFDFWFRNFSYTNNDQKWLRNYTVKLNGSLPVRDYLPNTTLDSLHHVYAVRDKGLRYVQLYKANPLQYADVELANFVYTGASIKPSDVSVAVFGGDCFLQRTTIKLMAQSAAPGNSKPVCVDFYSHNRINSQLRGADDNIDAMYPSEFNNYNDWFAHGFFDELSYNRSYDPRKDGQEKLPYVSTLPDDSIQPTTIVYSGIKIRGSVQDSYRDFSYSDITSLDTTYGPINFMKPMNGELYTIQDRRIQRQFFNTRGVLSTSDGATALIGDGAAFYRDGVTISTMGTKHKWSVINGRSFGGNDVWYWYDDVNRSIIRFGADGIVPVSTRAKFRTLLRSITELCRFNYTPADCFGIHGVWNEKLSEAVWVFRLARNYKGIWQQSVSVREGDVYSIQNQFYTESFEEIPVLYMCQTNLGLSILSPDVDTATWSRIEYGDESYMKFFSVVFSEAQNRFISVDDVYPKIFIKNENDVYYPRPKYPVGAILKKDSGLPLSFYNYLDGESKMVIGAVESVFNVDSNIQKKAVALRVNSELVPSQIEVRSENGQTFMIDSDFQGRLDQWDSPVLNNTPDIAGRKNDTGGIFGKYIRVKFIFAPLQFQRLINIVLKFKSVSRNYNT